MMKEQARTNHKLIEENALLKQRIQELEISEAERKRVEEALLESENKFNNFSEQALAGIYLIQDGIFKYVNPKFAQMFGYTVEECLNDMPFKNLVYADDLTKVEEQTGRRTSGEVEFVHYTFRGIKKKRQIFHVEIYGSVAVHQGRPAAAGTILDITERKRAEAALKESEEKYNQFFRTSRDCVFITSKDGSWIDLNDAAVELFGYSSGEELMQVKISNLYVNPEEMTKHRSIIAKNGYTKEFPFDLRRKDGKVIHTLITSVARYDTEGNVIGFQGTIRDITERKRAEEALKESERRYRELSIIDNLTQLYNSRYFYYQLEIEIDRANRYGQPLTLLLLDLDDFKQFNDTYGHIEGDHVLSRLGQVVKRCLRQTDSAYRYGGEEFTILLPMTTNENGSVAAERIRTEFRKETFSPVSGQEVHMTVSIGFAQYKTKEEIKAFVHRVDQFMYQAKKNGKDRVCSES